MKKIRLQLALLFGLMVLAAVPVLADFTGSLDYTVGHLDINDTNPSGFNFRLGYDFENYAFGGDYTTAGSSFNLSDLWAGYRFYQAGSLSSMAYLAYSNLSADNYSGHGFTLGVGGIYVLDPQWTLEGRLGYSLLGGVTIRDSSAANDLTTFALQANYQLDPDWSLQARYRHYGFTGNGDSAANLYSAGVTYRFPLAKSAAVNPTEKRNSSDSQNGAPSKQDSSAAAPSEQPNPAPLNPLSDAPAPPDDSAGRPNQDNAVAAAEPAKPDIAALNQALQPIFFDFDRANLRPDQIAVLQRNLAILQENAGAGAALFLIIGGHADRKGAAAYNLKLSQRRAQAVKQWLVNQGIAPARITITAYGSKYPHQTTPGWKWESDRWVDILVSAEPPVSGGKK